MWVTAAITVMVTMIMWTTVEHVSSTLWVRMMQVVLAAAATMVMTMIMFCTITESLGYPRGIFILKTTNENYFLQMAPPRVCTYPGTVLPDLC